MNKQLKHGLKLLLISITCTYPTLSSAIDISNIDKQVRQSQSKSIMFQNNRNTSTTNKQDTQPTQKKEAKVAQEKPVFVPYNHFGSGYKIVALINEEMISNKDLQERSNLFALTSGMVINESNHRLVLDKVMQNTIDEKIKLQEAKKNKLKVSPEEIALAYQNFEKSNNLLPGKFEQVLKDYKVSKEVFLSQIEANLLWNKLVQQKAGRIDVSVSQTEDELKRVEKDINTPKYMVSEIVISKKDGKHINELVEILQNNPKFELYATQFSQSPSAPSGGRLGWVSKGQLAKPLNDAILSLKEGQVTKAIPYRADYYILKLDKIYNPATDKKENPTEEEIRNYIRNKKTDEIANKYIRDLRNSAIIEKKF